MPTEGANSISDLNSSAPTSAGPAGEGDDELRQLKAVLLASFPALDGLISNTNATQTAGDTDPPDAATFSKLFETVNDSVAAGNNVPVGAIMMWAGTEAQIPAGWALCDGSNATPNLIDRFIIAGNDSTSRFNTGETAGNAWNDNVTPAQFTTHVGGGGTGTGTITIPDHNIVEGNLPLHDHRLFGSQPNDSGAGVSVGTNEASSVNWESGGQQDQRYNIAPTPTAPTTTQPTLGRSSNYGAASPTPLTHPAQDITIDGIEHSHNYMPRFFALAFIQFQGN